MGIAAALCIGAVNAAARAREIIIAVSFCRGQGPAQHAHRFGLAPNQLLLTLSFMPWPFCYLLLAALWAISYLRL